MPHQSFLCAPRWNKPPPLVRTLMVRIEFDFAVYDWPTLDVLSSTLE